MVAERCNSKTFAAVSSAMVLVIFTATAATTAQAALADYDLLGTCTFTSPWTGPSCMEFRSEGEGWDTTTMTERCAKETDSTLVMMDVDDTMGCSATTSSELAGWCVLTVGEDDGIMVEASPMMISAMGECSGNKMACETFVGGTWEAAANCETDTGTDTDSAVDDNDNDNEAEIAHDNSDGHSHSQSDGDNAITISEWHLPYTGPTAVDAYVGETIAFEWDAGHNVWIHPTMDCSTDGAIMVGETSPTTYTFTEADGSAEGTEMFFSCDIGNGAHCKMGQFLIATVFSGPRDSDSDSNDVDDTSGDSVTITIPSGTTTGTTATVACDESFTAPVVLPCPATAVLMVSYDGSQIECGGFLSVSEAAEVPTIQAAVVDADTLYTLLLVDTTSTPEDSVMGVHPILHYGAVNIPGSALLDGISLDDDTLEIFSSYRGPSPPQADDPWSTPDIQQTLFVYEYMLIAQPQEIASSDLVLSFGTNVMKFDFEQFVEDTVGVSFNADDVMSTYFQSGRCINDGTETTTAATSKSTTILVESFVDPKFMWESFMMDEVNMENMQDMQGMGDMEFDFSNYENEYKENSEQYEEWQRDGQQNWNMNSTKGSSMEIVEGVMILTAQIAGEEGGDGMGRGMGNTVTMNAGGKFPDLSSCAGLQFEAMTTRSGDGSEREEGAEYDYEGYMIDFGYKKLPDKVFGYGYRANLKVPIRSSSSSSSSSSDTTIAMDSGDMDMDMDMASVTATARQQDITNEGQQEEEQTFVNVMIPFEDFSLDYDFITGQMVTSCTDDATMCPDATTLQNLETMTISAVGTTNGVVQLHIKSIHGVGCDAPAITDTETDTDTDTTTNNLDTGDEQLTCSSSGSTTPDEIILESFADPSYDWGTQNDPVMGGESYSSMEMMEADGGTAYFTGEVKDVPFLGVPGFIKTQSSGMKPYPDVSCCESLKLTVMGMEDYAGYRVSFGTKRAKTGFFASGFKGNFDAPMGEYGEVIIPFDEFSVEWDEATGDQKITCAEDPTVCPDRDTLENMETIALWGEGVGGTLNLYVKAISAVGCASSSSSTGGDPTRSEKDIPAVAIENGAFTTLVAALSATDLVGALSSPAGPFTVFAPTDEAFDALPYGLIECLLVEQNLPILSDILLYHVASGEALSTDLSNGMNITTLQGEDVTVDLNNGVKINDSTVVGADVLASNGVIHVLNQVLVPPSVDVGAFMQTCTIKIVGVFGGAATTTTEEASAPVPVTSSASKRNSWSLVTTTTTMIMTSVVVVALTTSVL